MAEDEPDTPEMPPHALLELRRKALDPAGHGRVIFSGADMPRTGRVHDGPAGAFGWPRLAQLPWQRLRCGRSVTDTTLTAPGRRSRTVTLKLVSGPPTHLPSLWHQSVKENGNG
jgi:hypothetical protein